MPGVGVRISGGNSQGNVIGLSRTIAETGQAADFLVVPTQKHPLSTSTCLWGVFLLYLYAHGKAATNETTIYSAVRHARLR